MPPGGVARHTGFGGFATARPQSECPGCVRVYSRAVDNGAVSVLNAFAVNAFAMAIERLPGHAAARSSVDTATEQSTPSRSTTAPHMNFPWLSPPASEPSCVGAFWSSVFRSLALGTSLQALDRAGSVGAPPVVASRGVAWPQP